MPAPSQSSSLLHAQRLLEELDCCFLQGWRAQPPAAAPAPRRAPRACREALDSAGHLPETPRGDGPVYCLGTQGPLPSVSRCKAVCFWLYWENLFIGIIRPTKAEHTDT